MRRAEDMQREIDRLREALGAIAKMGVTTVHYCQPAEVAKAALDAMPRPTCPKCKAGQMAFASGTQSWHDVKYPHWRCEMWVGGGVCGATLPITTDVTAGLWGEGQLSTGAVDAHLAAGGSEPD